MKDIHERSVAYALKEGYEQRRFQFALIKGGRHPARFKARRMRGLPQARSGLRPLWTS